MAEIDMVKAKVENLHENYKTLLIAFMTLLGASGSMVFTAIKEQNPKFYILVAIAFTIAVFVSIGARKAWIDLDSKTEELNV